MPLATKPTPAALRRRLEKILRNAGELEDLVKRWNPKGRHFTTQRELLAATPGVRTFALAFMSRLQSSAPNMRRLSRGLAPRP